MTNLLSLLKQAFGYSEFRDGQLDVIAAALNGQDSFVLMPTGGGKSLCYQLPALILPKITVVVSPLMSLMKDQVDALKANGIAAEFINSSVSREDILSIFNRLRNNELKLLYVAPERLLQPHFLARLEEIGVSLFAIDEAHCISQWGHDFRPDYMALSILKQRFAGTPFMALTATADNATRQDILSQLSLNQPFVHLGSFDRPNIRYTVQEKLDPFRQLVSYLKNQDAACGIIYCNSRRKVDELTDKLKERGFNAAAYHAGLSNDERNSIQDAFKRDDYQLIVATVAFGMGVNKSNIRFVIHYELPRTIEAYYQETGRAGRDGVSAEALMFFDPADIGRMKRLLDNEEQTKRTEVLWQRFLAMAAFAEAQTCRRQVLLNYFGEARQTRCDNCDICLHPPQQFDATEVAQKALSCVYRVGQKFGMHHVIDVLRGEKTPKIIELNHDKLSTWGIGKHLNHAYWLSIFRQLIHYGLLQQDITAHSVLKLQEAARLVLRGETALFLAIPRLQSSVKEPERVIKQHYDRALLSRLKNLRKTIAIRDDVAPYIVFSDATLIEMCHMLPTDNTSFLAISGVGQSKLARYGADFLDEISDYLLENA